MKYSIFFLSLLFSCSDKLETIKQEFEPFSNTIIKISVTKSTQDTLWAKANVLTIIPRGSNSSNQLPIVETGNYYLKLEVDRPVKSQLSFNDNQFIVYVVPNDTIPVSLDLNEDSLTLSFSGKMELINQYYLDKRNYLGYTDLRFPMNQAVTSTSTYDQIKKSTDSLTQNEISFLEKFQNEIGGLPEYFLNYEKSEIRYAGAGFKTTKPRLNQERNIFVGELPRDYFDYLSTIPINNQSAVFSDDYQWFLDVYFMRNLPSSEFAGLSGYDRIAKFITHNNIESEKVLTGGARESYKQYLFSQVLPYYSDTLEIDSLINAFQIKQYYYSNRLSSSKSKTNIEMYNLTRGDTIPEFYVVNNMDSIVSIRSFRDKVVYVNLWATWCGPCIKNIPQLNEMIESYSNDSRVVFVNICLESEKDNWKSTIERYNLKGINLIAEGNWNKKIRAFFNASGIPKYSILDKENVVFKKNTAKAPMATKDINLILNTPRNNSE